VHSASALSRLICESAIQQTAPELELKKHASIYINVHMSQWQTKASGINFKFGSGAPRTTDADADWFLVQYDYG
jgi:hypothetical protein